MADYAKAKISELNGVELAFAEEYELVPSNFPFVDPGFTATDVKEAIIEAKATGTPGPPGPVGPPGEDALRYEQQITAETTPTVYHNFGKIPVDVVVSFSVVTEARRYNTFTYNTKTFGTGVSVTSAPTKVDPSTYTRTDGADFNSCTFTFVVPITGSIILLG